MAEKRKVRFFVVYCAEDDSHTTLEENEVICEPSVKVGDEVSFFCQRKAPWQGIVKAIGYDMLEMNKIRDEMNAKKPNRSGSFHADRKRKTALTARSVLKDLCTSRTTKQRKMNSDESNRLATSGDAEQTTKFVRNLFRTVKECAINYSNSDADPEVEDSVSGQDCGDKDKHEAVPEGSKKRASVLGTLLEETDYSGSSGNEKSILDEDDVNDSDSSDESLDAAEIALLQKLARKKKMEDINQLISLSKEQSAQSQSSVTSKRADGMLKVKPSPKTGAKEESLITSDGLKKISSQQDEKSSSSQSKTSGTGEGSAYQGSETDNLPKPVVKRSRYKSRYTKEVFKGEYFLWKASDPEVEQLWPKYEVYVKSKDLLDIKKKANSGKEVARLLVTKVFTEEAIKECSVTGRPASGRGRDNATLRPPLSEAGVKAIAEFAKARSKKKHWKEVSDTEVKKSMSNVLVETRYYERLAAEEAHQDSSS